MSYPPVLRISDLKNYVAIRGNKLIHKIVVEMKLLVKYAERVEVFICELGYYTSKWSVDKVNGVHSNINYKSLFPDKRGK